MEVFLNTPTQLLIHQNNIVVFVNIFTWYVTWRFRGLCLFTAKSLSPTEFWISRLTKSFLTAPNNVTQWALTMPSVIMSLIKLETDLVNLTCTSMGFSQREFHRCFDDMAIIISNRRTKLVRQVCLKVDNVSMSNYTNPKLMCDSKVNLFCLLWATL